MSIFEAYKQEFSSLQKEIRKNIDEFRDCDVESGFTTKDRQVEALLAQANDLLKQMEVEVRSQDASKRKELSETGTHICTHTHTLLHIFIILLFPTQHTNIHLYKRCGSDGI